MVKNQKLYSSSQKILVRDKNPEFGKNLSKRLFDFSVNVIRFLSTIPTKNEHFVFKIQLSRAGTSMGANFEEVQAAFSRKEFICKMAICLKESRESNYWLRICDELKLGDNSMRIQLLDQSLEFIKIFTTSLKTARANTKKI